MFSGLPDSFEDMVADGANPQKKDLLRRLVKKVLVHDKRTIEIWYALPNQASVRTPGHLAPHGGRVSNSCHESKPAHRDRTVSQRLTACLPKEEFPMPQPMTALQWC
jgi:hypothetical protein